MQEYHRKQRRWCKIKQRCHLSTPFRIYCHTVAANYVTKAWLEFDCQITLSLDLPIHWRVLVHILTLQSLIFMNYIPRLSEQVMLSGKVLDSKCLQILSCYRAAATLRSWTTVVVQILRAKNVFLQRLVKSFCTISKDKLLMNQKLKLVDGSMVCNEHTCYFCKYHL